MKPFSFTVEVDVQQGEGAWVRRDEIADEIIEALESANPDSFTGENEGEADVMEWTVTRTDE